MVGLSYIFESRYIHVEFQLLTRLKVSLLAQAIPGGDVCPFYIKLTSDTGKTVSRFNRVSQRTHDGGSICFRFITTLPDTWAISKRFIMLPVNRWDEEYERVLLGGLTCDSDDYYNSEQHSNAIYLPRYKKDKPLYIGFFNTGAYQETIGGYGGLQHCLIPQPKHILIDRDENGNLTTRIFNEQQKAEQLLKILGYEYN